MGFLDTTLGDDAEQPLPPDLAPGVERDAIELRAHGTKIELTRPREPGLTIRLRRAAPRASDGDVGESLPLLAPPRGRFGEPVAERRDTRGSILPTFIQEC